MADECREKPNVIVILTDDQGYGDLSCMGATDFRTPHLDQLAASGVRCTNWYANAPVCSPTRASLLSGRYPGNAGVRSILLGHRTATGLPPTVDTLASVLRDHGYRTYMSGKWHLGLAPGCRPEDHGFEHWFGHKAGCIDFFSHIFYWDQRINPLHDLWEDGKEIYRNGEYMTEMITDRAIDYIRDAREHDDPFFLYLAYNAPHYPMHAPAKYVDRFKHLPPDRRIMAAMLSAMDDGVGEVMAELERQGVRENTIIVFQSDNGPSREARNWLDGREDPYYGGKSGQFRGHKFSVFEGGIRVPGIWSWPARIAAGQVLDTPGASMDVLPTILSAVGGDPREYDLDGMDLLAHFTQQESLPSRDLFFEQGKQLAIRRDNWKLVLNGQLVEHEKPLAKVFLSDLSNDPAERENLADAHQPLVQELQRAAETWQAGIQKRFDALANLTSTTTQAQ